MSINDVNNFAINNNINLSNNELNFIYKFIKDNYLTLINNPNNFNLINYKDKFSQENFIKINNIINEYKNKYNF